MPELKTYKIFISHSWTYSDAYEKLCDLLGDAPNFVYSNYSIPKDDPVHTSGSDQALYNAIENKIRFCDVILIMAGKYATFSKWISNEIKIAKEEFTYGKPVIGIRPWANAQISSLVTDKADEIVGWNSSSIVGAIRRHA